MRPFLRALIHFPVGLFNAFLLWFNTPLGIIFSIGFIAYEIIEDWRIYDRSYLDLYGWLFGLGIGGVIWFLIDYLA